MDVFGKLEMPLPLAVQSTSKHICGSAQAQITLKMGTDVGGEVRVDSVLCCRYFVSLWWGDQ